MPTIEMTDVIMVKRQVEIPETCPVCGASFIENAGEALHYEDVYLGAGYGGLVYANQEVSQDVSIEGDADDFPDAVGTVEVACANCQDIYGGDDERRFRIEAKVEEHGEAYN